MKRIDKTAQKAYLENRLTRNAFEDTTVNQEVLTIIEAVREGRDQAVKSMTERFDKVAIDTFKVQQAEIAEAYALIDPVLIEDLRKAMANINDFHTRQVETSFSVAVDALSCLEERVSAIETVGLYVPGGTAPLPSTVLMNAVPAKLAGVKKTVMVSPPNREGKLAASVLVAADLVGVDEIYKVGGAQAIAALAFGTETIPKVDKVVGPGNKYVTAAKRLLNGHVGIDMIAGPSEIVIVADASANPKFVAADLLSQAEHDQDATAILLTPSSTLANKVAEEVKEQLAVLTRKAIAKASLENYGAILVTDTLDEVIDIANQLAPEHLEIMTVKDDYVLDRIYQAGSIFVGPYSAEPVGDYFAGTNHTLPTSGTARFSSPLSVRDFQKRTQIIHYHQETFKKSAQRIIRLANEEGLTAHANAIQVRLEEEKDND